MKKNSTKKKPFENLALAVLYHPELPEPLFDDIRYAVTTFFNEHIDQEEIQDFERQPAYFEMLFRGYRKQQKRIADNPELARPAELRYMEGVQ